MFQTNRQDHTTHQGGYHDVAPDVTPDVDPDANKEMADDVDPDANKLHPS